MRSQPNFHENRIPLKKEVQKHYILVFIKQSLDYQLSWKIEHIEEVPDFGLHIFYNNLKKKE